MTKQVITDHFNEKVIYLKVKIIVYALEMI